MTRRCHYCGAAATTKDHIVPKALGGVDATYNLVDSCRPCNQAKADNMPTCGCAKCSAAVLMPRRDDGQVAIRAAAALTSGGNRRRSRKSKRSRRWAVDAEGWSHR